MEFRQIYVRLLNSLDIKTHRYMYKSFFMDERIVGISGPHGVGKTTMMLQYIKENLYGKTEALYFSADHIYFNENSLYEFIKKTYLEEGVKIFFIDEIHRYFSWSQEVKNIYDSFPDIKIVFSGSSMLDLIKGKYDLSRRAVLLRLEGVSFREYLYMLDIYKTEPFKFDELIKNREEISETLSMVPKISGHFKEYLKYGYYPFSLENRKTFSDKILSIIDKTIHIDIAGFYNLKTQNLYLFKNILLFLSTSPPGQFSIHNLAQSLKVDDKTVINYLEILSETGLVRPLTYRSGGHTMLRKPVKYYLNNSSLYHTLSHDVLDNNSTGSMRESFFLSMIQNGGLEAHYSNEGDFTVEGYTFEVGGKNKKTKQIQNIDNSFLVKDDILVAGKKEIPLYLFGFLY